MPLGVTQSIRILLDVNSCVNAASSILILVLIHALSLRIKGYVLLIYSMTVCQFVFDAALMMLFECRQTDMDCLNSCFFMASSFGIASQGFSVIIALIVSYIIASRRRFDIDKYFRYMVLVVTVCSVSVGTIRVLASSRPAFPISVKESIYLYDAMRYLEILVNAVAVGVIFSHLHGMRFHELDNNPIYVLAKKLMLYPAVQLLSRVGSTQYEDIYGISFPSDADGWSTKSVQAVLYAILTPLGGFLSLCIFLGVQPGAWRLLRSWLYCQPQKDEPDDDARSPVLSANNSSRQDFDDLRGAIGGADSYDDDFATETGFHQRDSGLTISVAGLSSLQGSRMLGGEKLDSLSTVFSATGRSSLHTPKKLADLSEEQLVEVIASQGQTPTGSAGGILKSASQNDLSKPLI